VSLTGLVRGQLTNVSNIKCGSVGVHEFLVCGGSGVAATDYTRERRVVWDLGHRLRRGSSRARLDEETELTSRGRDLNSSGSS
jgi:hypothetical protein